MSDLTPEQQARQQIDAQLQACGWTVHQPERWMVAEVPTQIIRVTSSFRARRRGELAERRS